MQESTDALSADLRVECGAVLEISSARALHQRLLNALKHDGQVVLAGQDIERVDTPSLQLLAAFVAAAGRRELTVVWEGVSPALVQAARLLGLGEALGLPAPVDGGPSAQQQHQEHTDGQSPCSR